MLMRSATRHSNGWSVWTGTILPVLVLLGFSLSGLMVANPEEGGSPALQPEAAYVLHAAHAASTADWWTVLHLVNRGTLSTSVQVEVFDGAGTPVAADTIPILHPGSAWQSDLDDLFGPELGSDLWIRVTSQTELIGAVEFGTRDGLARAVLPLFDIPTPQVVFPYVYTTPSTGESYYTGITVLNPGTADAAVQLFAYSENGDALANLSTVVGPGTKYVRLVDQIFPDVPDPNAIRMIWVQSDQPVLAFELFGKWNEYGVAGLPAVDIAAVSSPPSKTDCAEAVRLPTGDLVYNEIPANDEWFTGMTVCNLTNAPARVSAQLLDAAGNNINTVWWDLAPYQQLTREVWTFFGVEPDSAAVDGRVKADSPIAGFELMLSRAGAFRFDGLEAVYRVYKQLDFPFIRHDADFTTRLHLTKLYPFVNAITLTAYDTGGHVLGTYSDTLLSVYSIYLDLDTLFPGVADQVAWIHVDAQDKLVGSAFIQSTDGQCLISYAALGRQ
jgi:hypothetical protein